MNFRNMTVKGQLTFAFGLLVALVLGVALVAVQALVNAHEKFTFYNEVTVKQNHLVDDVRAAISARAIAARNLVLSTEPADREMEYAAAVKAHQATEESMARLNLALKDNPSPLPGDVRMVAEMGRIESLYGPVALAILKLAMEGKNEEAIARINKDCRPLLVALVKASQQGGDSVLDEGSGYNQARGLLLLASALAIAAALVMGFLITRNLVGALGGEPRQAADLARSVAQGDLTMPIQLKVGDMSSLMAQLKRMQESLVGVVSTVRQGSDGVATASAEISQGNHDLSSRTEQQASALQQTAASMEQLSSTVRQNADNARQANQLAVSASSVAVQGGAVVSEVVETMKGINDSSKKIADIIGVIDGIAFQTNILALNAAVEAARAGEQGRGFAVVASEVRNLAGRSAEAAKEIKSLISASVVRVEHGSALVDKAGTTMTEVVAAIRRVTDIMGEISAASSEQSTGVSQVGQAISQMDHTTQQNAALVEQMAAAASSMKTQAQDLVDAVAVFKVGQGDAAAVPHARVAAIQPQAAVPVAVRAVAAAAKAKPATLGAARRLPLRAVAPAGAGHQEDWAAF
nr:methyl-accepting chemotaxis protein [uncultured Albidiferax sp.]